MKQIAIVMICVLGVAFSAQAQTRESQKLARWYAKGNYQKVVAKASSWGNKYAGSPHMHYWRAKGHWGLYAQGQNVRDLAMAMQWYAKAASLDNGGSVTQADEAFTADFQEALASTAAQYHEKGNRRRTKRYVLYLAKHFGDTLAFYTAYSAAPTPATASAVAATGATMAMAPTGTLALASTLPAWSQAEGFTFPGELPQRQAIAQFAKTLEGTTYTWAGETPEKGFDCSGFVLYVFRNFQFNFHHGTKHAVLLGEEVTETKAKVGDWVFFGSRQPDGSFRPYHMGLVYSSGGQEGLQIIHCVSRGVSIDSLEEGYWAGRERIYKNLIDPMAGQPLP